MARFWHPGFGRWPLWLKSLHVVSGALMAVVLVRLFLRGFEFDTWTFLWIAYGCWYGLFVRWWSDRGGERDSQGQKGSWLF